MSDLKEYEVWIEGYAATGESSTASRLLRPNETNSKWIGINFQQACVKAMNELKWEMLSTMPQALGSCHYDPKRNAYWACRFFETEKESRESFG